MTIKGASELQVDDEDRNWSEGESYFNNKIRNWTVELLVFGSLLLLSHFKLKKWRRPMEIELPDLKNLNDVHDVKIKQENKDDLLIYRLAQLTCTVAVSTGFSCLILLPVSVWCNEVKVLCSASCELAFYQYYKSSVWCPSWWFEWITADLLLEVWNQVSVLTSLFLFVILPFVFFLTEADGFSFGPRGGLKAKVYETVIIFLLVLLLIAAFFFVLLKLLGAYDISSSWWSLVTSMVIEVTPMLRTCISLIATFSLILAVPIGQQAGLDKAMEAIILVKPKSAIRSDLRRITIERDHIRRRLRYRHRVRRLSATPAELKSREQSLQADSDRLEYLANQSFVSRFLMRPLWLVGALYLVCGGIAICLTRAAQILFPEWLDFGSHSTLRFSPTHFGVWSLGKSFGYLSPLFSFTKFALAIWITFTAFLGFWAYLPRSWKYVN